MKKSYIFIFFILFLTNCTFGLNIKVRLLSTYSPQKVIVSAISGKYNLLCDNNKLTTVELNTGNALTLSYLNGKIVVEQGVTLIGTYSTVEFLGAKYNNVFSLHIDGLPQDRMYEDELRVSIGKGELILINTIGLEKYVAGVVQSEVYGSSDDVEFFKIQAIAARTYCLANIHKHIKEGCNLCDGVHCQSYKGRCTKGDILRATYETFSDVIVDSNNKLISPAYHSNSGGMTEAASQIWLHDIPYLQSKEDSFSINARNAKWEKIIPQKMWIDYFVKHYGDKYGRSGACQDSILNYKQPVRIAKWVIDGDTILSKNIREHFKLRSAFFSVTPHGDNVHLSGKGYGHGVGLSQEGAIEMVKKGYSCIDILQFYFNNVKILKYTEIIDL